MHSVLRHFWDGLVGREKAVPPAPEPPADRRGSPRSEAHTAISLQWPSVDGEWQSTPGLAVNVSNSGLAVSAATAPEVGQACWILRAQAPAIRGMVRRVETEDAGDVEAEAESKSDRRYRIALEVVRREKRRYERQPTDGPARARWVGAHGAPEICDCRVRNRSDAGMQIELERAIPEGSYVRVTGRQVECAGSLRYCRRIDGRDGYVAGLQFVDRPAPRERASAIFAEMA